MSVGMMSVFKDSGYFGSRMGATISGMFTPNPAKFLDKDGCPNCDRIGFVQVAQGTRRFHPNFDDPTMPVEPFVDGGIPYPHGTTSNPRSGNKIDFEDEPQGSVYGYFSFASHYSMRFETCVVCLKGREGITFNEAGFTPYMTDLTVQGITVYGCFSWGFAFNWNPTRKSYDYFQYVNDEQTRGMGSASSIYQPSATLSGPSQFWTNAVIGGSIY